MAERNAPLPMRPTKLFGRIMEVMNAPSYRLARKLMTPKPGQQLMEIGFGSGRLLEMLAQSATDVHLAGIDPTEAMVEMARARRTLVRRAGSIDLKCGVPEALPWADSMFDAVAAVHCFQFWKDPEQAVREILRVLVPGGRLVVILRNHEGHAPAWLPNPISRSGNEYDGACALLSESGFAQVRGGGRAGTSKAIMASL